MVMEQSKTARKNARKKAARKAAAEKVSEALKQKLAGQETLREFVPKPVAPARVATNALREGDMTQFVTVKEAWQLHLLHHILRPKSHIVPPTPFHAELDAERVEVGMLGVIGGASFIADREFLTNSTRAHHGRSASGSFSINRENNYIPITGRSLVNFTLTGNQEAYIWFDPYDWDYPIKMNTALATDTFRMNGSYVSAAPYTPNISSTRLSYRFGWSPGGDPRVVPTEFANCAGVGMAANTTAFALPVYPHDASIASASGPFSFGALFYATNVLQWVCDATLRVSVVNATAFSAVGMRARTHDVTAHRYAERIEDPATGDYGLTTPAVDARYAETTWCGSAWDVPYRYRQINSATNVISPLPVSEAANASYLPGGQSNWHSLQRALENLVSPVEVFQTTDTPTRTITYSVELIVNKCLIPVSTLSTSVPAEHLTFPASLPRWYSALCYSATVYPHDESTQKSSMPMLIPMQAQREAMALKAVASDASNNRPIQLLSTVVAKEPKSVLARVANAGEEADKAMRSVAGAAHTAWTIGRFAKSIWDKVKLGGKAIAAAAPLLLSAI